MNVKEWFADNVTQIIDIIKTFREVKLTCYTLKKKSNIQIRLKSGSEISLEAFKISKTKEFGLDTFLWREGDLCPTFIYRAGPSIGQVTVGIESAIKADSPMGQ